MFKPKQKVVALHPDGNYYYGVVVSATGKKVKVKFDAKEIFDVAVAEVTDKKEYDKQLEEQTKEQEMKKKKEKKADKHKETKKGKKADLDEDDSLDDIDNDTDAEEAEEAEEADEEKDVDFSDMSRAELKAYIAENELNIKVTKDMDEESIADAIKEAMEEKGESDDEEEDTPKGKKKKSDDDDDDSEESNDDDEEDSDSDDDDEKDADDDDEEDSPKAKKKSSDDDDDEDEIPVGKKKWYAEGDDDDSAYAPEKRGTFRFWIPTGEKRLFTIVSPKPITVREHTLKSNGKFYQYTCLAPTGERCPLCENNNYPYLAKAFYIIDHSEYTSKKGEKISNQLRLLVMKQGSYQLLKGVVSEYFDGQDEWTYKGLKIRASRSEAKKSANTGDIFVVKEKTKLKDEWKKTQEELANEFKPLSRDALKSKVHFSDDDEEQPKKRRNREDDDD